ncbi:hypothetical protein ACFQX6_47615 [Streptosporangium lutulentum]
MNRADVFTDPGPASRSSSWNASIGANAASGPSPDSGSSSHQDRPVDR